MNYYIIPKNNCISELTPVFSNAIHPCISHSLIYYLNDIYQQMSTIPEKDACEIKKAVNPLEFVFSTVPGSSFSVSKIKTDNNVFYELMELLQTCNLMDYLTESPHLSICHIGPNNETTNYLLDMIREDKNDNLVALNFDVNLLNSMFLQQQHDNQAKFDVMLVEWTDSEYKNVNTNIRNMLLTLACISKMQKVNGVSIVKIDNLFYRPILEVIFLLSSLYDKVALVKPSNSNILSGERYLVCKGFGENINADNIVNLNSQIDDRIIRLFSVYNSETIVSLLNHELPYFFINRIEEPNAIIGQQQLESYDHVINIYKNKNKDDKIDTLKRNHIQKCIQWCEKNQIPHNKFSDKVNIFLLPKKRELEIGLSTSSASSTSSSSSSSEEETEEAEVV